MTTTHTRSTTPAGTPPSTATEIDHHLSQLEAHRQRQLAALPASDLDAVSASYRGAIERTLDEIRAARARALAGRYGVCTGCAEQISVQRLELRPYAAQCSPCAQRS